MPIDTFSPACLRYLKLLGIEKIPSGLHGLREIVRRHLYRVPFENISKLLLAGREPGGRAISLEEYLDGIEFRDFGGTCYTLNPFFADLLRELGYDVDLLGADMSTPNVHTCLRARIGDADYHVDVGFAAPFREPIPLAALPVQIDEGGNRYVLVRDDMTDSLRLQMFSGAENGAGYIAHGPPRSRQFFDPVVLSSYTPAATFMNWLRISRVFDTHSMDLINRKLYRHAQGETSVTLLQSMQDLIVAVRDEFDMPRCPIEDAVAVLERNTGREFFG